MGYGGLVELREGPSRVVRLLRKLIWLSMLATILLSALTYPLAFQPQLLQRLDLFMSKFKTLNAIYYGQVRNLMTFGHSPLILKESVAQGCLLAALCAFSVLKLVEAWERRKGRKLSGGFRAPAKLHQNIYMWIALFLLFAGYTAIYRSPTIHTSVRTAISLGLGIAGFIILCDLPLTRRHVIEFMGIVCLCGLVISFVSILQHLELSDRFMPPFKNEARNRVGSLIGHNTGVSSWLLFPLSFSMYFAAASLGRAARRLNLVLVLMILFVIIAAQSRAIWVLGAVMVGGYGAFLLRTVARRHAVRLAVIAAICVAGLIVSQTVNPESNPLARHAVSLSERVTKWILDPGQLLRETRLRILLASMPLVADKPVIGSGLGSFAFIYPAAQGTFLRDRPDTILGLTTKRTDLAHNDYLQLIIECGFVGFILLAIPTFLVLRRGWRNFRATRDDRNKCLLAALIAPTIAVGTQALVDFPFHIVPIGMLAVCCLAFWRNGKRILGDADQQALNISSGESEQRISFSIGAVAAITAAGMCLGWTPVLFRFLYIELASDMYFMEANGNQNFARAQPEGAVQMKRRALDAAREGYRKAIHLNPFSGVAYEGMVSAYRFLGLLDYNAYQDALARKDSKAAEYYKKSSQANYEAAIMQSKNQWNSGELQYHYTLYQWADAYKMVARLNPDIPNYYESAKSAFKKAIDMNISDGASEFELAEMLARQQTPDAAGAAHWRQVLFLVDPDFGWEQYVLPALKAALRGDFTGAGSRLGKIARDVPNNWKVKLAEADIDLRAAFWPPPEIDTTATAEQRMAYAKPWLEAGMSRVEEAEREHADDYGVRSLRLAYDIALGKYADAVESGDRLYAENRNDQDVAVLRYLAAKKIGLSRIPWKSYDTDTEYFRRLQRARMYYLNEVDTGAWQLGRMAANGAQLGLDEGLRAAAYLKTQNQWELVAAIKRSLDITAPGDPAVVQLEKEIAAHIPGKTSGP